MADRYAIRTSGLTKRYGDRVVVDRVDLALPEARVTGFVGPNGAGKTTTLRMLLGLVRPDAGTGEVLGRSIAHPAAYLDRVGALIESPAFYPTLSGRRNLDVLARLGGQGATEVRGVLERVGLAERAGDLFRTYSLGMKQRLGVAAALLPSPELLILDEPGNGLDPAGIREMRALMRELADAGTAVFVSSHVLAEIEAICDHLVVIDRGRLVFQGPTSSLLVGHAGRIAARPERAADLHALLGICVAAGHPGEIVDGEVRVSAPAGWAGELNRRAMAEGITLVALGVARATLEEAFFSVTGVSLPAGPAALVADGAAPS